MSQAEVVHVAAGVITDSQGRVLVSKRASDSHQGGLWELPGGKCEPDESIRQALERELQEELGISVTAARPLIVIRHDYPDLCVCLDVWKVQDYRGEPAGLEGQPLKWIPAEQLTTLDMPAADKPVISAIRLPSAYLITPDPVDGTDTFLTQLDVVLKRGIRLLCLRATNLDQDAYAGLASQAIRLCHQHGARILLSRHHELVKSLGADGVHISSRQLREQAHRPVDSPYWVAVSCHDRDELERAGQLGADFCVLSPVKATGSHPGVQPLGWEKFSELVADCNLPVYALGGMGLEDVEQSFQCGGQGISAISALWTA